MRIDLHTHSSVSDGTDRPDDLVRRAKEVGLDVVALTDHDTFDGWAAALAAGQETGVEVVPGAEISTDLRGHGVHLLAYLVDPENEPLAEELARVRHDRRTRLARIAAALTAAELPLDVADILAHSPDAATVGRPHVADAMIAKGYVRDREEAFAWWLGQGRPGWAAKYAPPIDEAIHLVHAAGGVCVLAHPWGREGARRALTPSSIEALRDAGLDGIEVDHQDHDDASRRTLRRLAQELGLVVTGSSDYHGTGKFDHELGVNTTAPEEWERLRSLAGGDHVRLDRDEPTRSP
ncbi:PHP domain-containing protein [Jiangella mangrovi]|uniref:Putative metal-dependent phosphoesterase TrpH n=1 Tax=Jiangella mangrovi TaxID=1524084 RepID=A0A7W9GL19_9ACTN|nr:PHP domain-containing protein [Jiangella mangrovi]MBB5785852.1 putative metal-dependent phosphoesterase TrpH [Jiangella mangrovi]